MIVWRVARWVALGALLVAGYLVGDRIWEASDDIRAGLLVADPAVPPTASVLEVGDGFVVLQRTAASQAPARWGLAGPRGYAIAGPVRAIDGERVTRDLAVVEGTIAAGDVAAIDAAAAPPGTVDAWQRVVVTGDLGIYPAWLAPGDDTDWVIFVHDRGEAATRQANRILPLLQERGHPVLAISYRDDGVGPRADGLATWGLQEWQDVDAAARYAVREGAERLVVVGYGMGATIATLFLQESPLAARVTAAVFDSAVLDVGESAGLLLGDGGVPGLFIGPARAIASVRFDLHWSRLDLVERAAAFPVPLLLLHGTADRLTPVALADAFAAAAEGAVYERFPGGGHTGLWNSDPDRYEAAVRSFLAGTGDPE